MSPRRALKHGHEKTPANRKIRERLYSAEKAQPCDGVYLQAPMVTLPKATFASWHVLPPVHSASVWQACTSFAPQDAWQRVPALVIKVPQAAVGIFAGLPENEPLVSGTIQQTSPLPQSLVSWQSNANFSFAGSLGSGQSSTLAAQLDLSNSPAPAGLRPQQQVSPFWHSGPIPEPFANANGQNGPLVGLAFDEHMVPLEEPLLLPLDEPPLEEPLLLPLEDPLSMPLDEPPPLEEPLLPPPLVDDLPLLPELLLGFAPSLQAASTPRPETSVAKMKKALR
jgi:hypothetical protein